MKHNREIRFLPGKVELRALTPAEKEAGYIGAIEGFIPYESDSRQMRDITGKPFVERLAPGVFTRSLADAGQIVFADVGHNDAATFARSGVNLAIAETAQGLKWSALLPDTTVGRDLKTNVSLGIIDGTSFEFQIRSEGAQRTGETWAKRGAEAVRTITDAILHRVNPVTEPAYLQTALALRAAGAAGEVAIPAEAPPPPPAHDLATRDWEQRVRFL